MSKPAEPVAPTDLPADELSKPNPLTRKGSKQGLRKKGSSKCLSESSPTLPRPESPSLVAPSSNDSTESSALDTSSSNHTTNPSIAASPGSLSGRRQRSSGKLKMTSAGDDDDVLRSSDSSSPRSRPAVTTDWAISSPRSGPHYQAALAADPALTYVPMRIFVATDIAYITHRSSASNTSSAAGLAKPLELVSLSLGRLWNLTTLLLIAGEKLSMPAQSLYLKAKMARVLTIHDLREDDELIVCQHLEGPFALLERKENALAFMRVSPRSRLGSSPAEMIAPTAIVAPNAAPSSPLTARPDAPKSRPPSVSLSASDRIPYKTPSPEPRDTDSHALPLLAKPPSSESVSSLGRKKSRPSVSAEDSASNSSSPSKATARKLKTAYASQHAPSSPTLTNGTASSSSDSIERTHSTPTRLRVNAGKHVRRFSKGSSLLDASSLRPTVPKLQMPAKDEEEDSQAVFSTPITSQLPFEGRRLIRRDSSSFIHSMLNEEIKLNAIAAIKEHDKSITVSPHHPVVEFHGDTGKARSSYSVEALYLELKRSRSLPDVWMHGKASSTRKQKVWGSICDASLRAGSSTTSNTSTYRDDDADFSDDDASSMTSSTTIDAEMEDQNLNPLTMSEEDVVKRMRQEEKQDVTNLQMMDNEVQAGTLRALTRRLFWEYQNDELIQQFLLTYDLFINHLSLLKTLIMLFRVPIADANAATKATGSLTPQPSRRATSRLKPDVLSSPRGSPTPRGAEGNISARSSDLSESESNDSIVPAPSSSSLSLGSASGMKTVIQHRILASIKLWIELRYEVLSLKSNRSFFVLFNEFCDYLSNSSVEKHKVYASTLLQAVKNAKVNRMSFRRNLELSKPPPARNTRTSTISMSPRSAASAPASSSSATPPKITDFSPHDWAEYFTLREQSFFGRVRLKEYRLVSFGSKDMAKKSPHLDKLINHLNKVSFWVATAIFRCEGFAEPTARARATIITHFIKVMEELRLMQNYSTAMAIWSALSIPPVSRLEKSWAHVSSEANQLMAQVTRLREGNFKLYRELVDVAEPPYIPIQEVLLKDLTFIEENPTILDNGWINFSKIFMLGKAYSSLKSSQQTLYEFKYPHGVHAFYKLHGNMTLEQLYDYSKVVEPSANDLERLARAESEKRELERRERKYRDLIVKYQKKMPSKQDLAQLFTYDTTLDTLVYSLDQCAVFFVHLEQVCESASLDYYRTWSTEWRAAILKTPDKLREVGIRIYDTFLAASSDSAISLNNQSARAAVFRAVKSAGSGPVTGDIFDQINYEVRARLKPLLLDFKRSLQ